MPNIDLSILNQKATPAFFADTLANRPAPSFVGRIFISTDTLDLYRDTGTAWLLLSPSSTGTITGSGAAGQVTYFSGTSSITGSNDLFWDSVNGHLGIGTNTPGTALGINHDQNQIIQLNQTTATNDTKIAFQNSGTPLWRIGNSYNAGANDFAIFDTINSLERFSVKNTGQTFVGAQTTTSGRFVVNNATSDNHIVVIGATAPSIRINNSGTGATRLIGLGLATGVNNFIQGTTGGELAIFNSSTTASPILFGVYDAGAGNTQEAARISSARNFLIGTITDTGQKLQVSGTSIFNGNLLANSGMTLNGGSMVIQSSAIVRGYFGDVDGDTNIQIRAENAFSVKTGGNNTRLTIASTGAATFSGSVTTNSSFRTDGGVLQLFRASVFRGGLYTYDAAIGSGTDYSTTITSEANTYFLAGGSITRAMSLIGSTGNLLIGTTTDNGRKLQVNGISSFGTSSTGEILINDTNIGPNILINGGAGSNAVAQSAYIRMGDNSNFRFWIQQLNASNNYAYWFFNGGSWSNVSYLDCITGAYVALSDKNKKKNFVDSYLGLDAVLKLKPTLYNMENQKDEENKQLGFIAQDVKDIIPQAYQESGDFIGLNYNPIIAVLTKAIQELNTKIENLK
jgi:hypothetical protein